MLGEGVSVWGERERVWGERERVWGEGERVWWREERDAARLSPTGVPLSVKRGASTMATTSAELQIETREQLSHKL